jgi:hypothetical protein
MRSRNAKKSSRSRQSRNTVRRHNSPDLNMEILKEGGGNRK